MKKTLSLLVVLMAIGSVAFASGSPGAEANMAVVRNGATYKLYYNGPHQSDVTISIRDSDGRVVFREVLKNVDGFVRPYSFSHLSAGDYTIEIEDGNGLITKKIRYEMANIAKSAHVLKVTDSERKYVLMISSKDPSSLTVRILNGSGNVIYSQKEEIHGDFAKVYNLARFDGAGRFEIADDSGNLKSISY